MGRKQQPPADEPETQDPSTDTPATIPEVEVSLEAPPAEVPNLPEPPQPFIALRVFTAMSGIRWDQLAGFVAYAKANKLGPLTMEGWLAEVQKFNNRPTL